MISVAQLESLDFEFNERFERYELNEITVEFFTDETVIKLHDFQCYGIRDVRDLTKLIELVYGK
jgi:hypothetical protein